MSISRTQSYAWAAFSPATDVVPDSDDVLDVSQAEYISVQVDTTDAGSVSDDIDINVESSPDGSTWDETPYAEINVGDNKIRTFLVSPGVVKIRFRADNNHASSDAAPTAIVAVRDKV